MVDTICLCNKTCISSLKIYSHLNLFFLRLSLGQKCDKSISFISLFGNSRDSECLLCASCSAPHKLCKGEPSQTMWVPEQSFQGLKADRHWSNITSVPESIIKHFLWRTVIKRHWGKYKIFDPVWWSTMVEQGIERNLQVIGEEPQAKHPRKRKGKVSRVWGG